MAAIRDFLANLKGGGARPNRFEVVIDFPAFAATSDTIRKTAFLVQSTQIPGSNLGVMEVMFRGRPLKLPGDRTFDDWECTFYNDTDFDIHNALERWHNAINSYNTNVGLVLPEEYLASASVFQLDSQDRRVKEVTMMYMFPTVVAPIELAQDSNDTIETFSCTFAYSDIINGNST